MVGLKGTIFANGDGAGASESMGGNERERHETAHSSYITYVFGTIWRTLRVSEGRRRATYAFGSIIACIIACLIQAVS